MLFDPAFFESLTPTRAVAVFPARWPLFSGHFPSEAIVPAYALIGLVRAHAEDALGAPIEIAAIDRMKLARSLDPGERIVSELTLAPPQGAVVSARSRLSTPSGEEIGMVALSVRVGA
jgi:hypothetical protein